MKPDMKVSWDRHLKNGNVWGVEVELSMQDTPGDFYTYTCLLYTSPSPRDRSLSRMPSSA